MDQAKFLGGGGKGAKQKIQISHFTFRISHFTFHIFYLWDARFALTYMIKEGCHDTCDSLPDVKLS